MTSDDDRKDKVFPSHEDAVVLRIKNPTVLLTGTGRQPDLEKAKLELKLLNLDGQGIRAMYYDPDLEKTWIVSGLPSDPPFEVNYGWKLWLWDDKDDKRNPELKTVAMDNAGRITGIINHTSSQTIDGKMVDTTHFSETGMRAATGLESPESVCVVKSAGKRYLLLIDDGVQSSPYTLIPIIP